MPLAWHPSQPGGTWLAKAKAKAKAGHCTMVMHSCIRHSRKAHQWKSIGAFRCDSTKGTCDSVKTSRVLTWHKILSFVARDYSYDKLVTRSRSGNPWGVA